MNINDICGAMDDLQVEYSHADDALVHVIGRGGEPKAIDGFDMVNERLFVLGENGKPAVSSEVVEDIYRKLYTVDAILTELEREGAVNVPIDLVKGLLMPAQKAAEIMVGEESDKLRKSFEVMLSSC